MYIAKAASLQTLDLSRQVGAAIFSEQGNIITTGTNEVPKAGGGIYTEDDSIDAREYTLGEDSNERIKKTLLAEILVKINGDSVDIDKTIKSLERTQFMDALEYGRIVHAEMNAICEAARVGQSVKNAILYSTTFPCHMCSKHIVASGISRVVFLEPYPKSLTNELHKDSVQIEREDRGKYIDHGSVNFDHFYGVSPSRFANLFSRGKRKNRESGAFEEWSSGKSLINVGENFIVYRDMETYITENIVIPALTVINLDPSNLDQV